MLDLAAQGQFNASPLRVWASSTSSLTVNTNGTVSGTNSVLTNTLVKSVADYLAEGNVPTFDGVNYMAIFRPTPLRTFKNNLETINQYTPEGWHVIMNGEKGRYEGIRFVEQTNVPLTVFPSGSTATDRGYFFGSDTVVEAFAIPEEIRGKIPTDYGRSRGVAWYAELGFGIAHTEVPGARILVWDSQ